MLVHEALQEQLIRERRAQLGRVDDAAVPRSTGPKRTTPGFVRTIVPAFTHGLFGLPAPQRAARGGC